MIFQLLLHVVFCSMVYSMNNVYGVYNCTTYTNRRLEDGIFQTFSPIGPQMCAKECFSLQTCTSFNYNRHGYQCELVSSDGTTSSALTEDQSYVHIDKMTCIQDVCSSITCPPNSQCVILHNTSPVCVVSGCGPPPVVENANPVDTVIGFVGKHVNYSCIGDCPLNGNPQVTCGANGSWSKPPTCQGCCGSDGYQYIESLNTCFKLYTKKVTWFEANYTCYTDQGQLLMVQNQNSYDVIKNHFYDAVGMIPYDSCLGSHGVWIGATDLKNGGNFMWTNGESFTYWQMSQVDANGYGCQQIIAADCLLLLMSDNRWNDRGCWGEFYPFICMRLNN